MSPTRSESDGRHDFDFLFGDWRVHNRRLADMLDPECGEWLEFESRAHAFPLLGGLGNSDGYKVDAHPVTGEPFEGMTVRLFEPETGLWRIWWASTANPGHLDPPMLGSFTGGHGVFFGDDEVGGTPVKVRFDWKDITATSARWEQAFSFDQGATWKTNWIMAFTRVEG